MQAPQETAYNGGLIDFQSSVMQADLGAALYAHQLSSASNQYHNAHPGVSGYATAPPVSHMHTHPHPAPSAHAYSAPPAVHPGYGVPPVNAGYSPAPAVQSMMMASTPGQCIAGPPAFLHLHGQVYAPVEQPGPSVAEPAPAVVKEAVVPTGRALDRLVEQRINQRVEEFEAKQRKGLGASAGRKAKKAESLKELNSQMRAQLRAY